MLSHVRKSVSGSLVLLQEEMNLGMRLVKRLACSISESFSFARDCNHLVFWIKDGSEVLKLVNNDMSYVDI